MWGLEAGQGDQGEGSVYIAGLEASALLTPLHTGPFFVPLLTQIDLTLHLLEGAGDSLGAYSRGLQAPAL